MKRLFDRLGIPSLLWGLLLAGGVAFLIWGPDAPHRDVPSTNGDTAMALGIVSLLMVALGIVLRGVRVMAHSERRRSDGFEWRRPPTRRLASLGLIFFVGYMLAEESDFALAVWRQGHWLSIAIVGALGLLGLGIIVSEIVRLFDNSVVLSVTSTGLTVGKRAAAWSQVEAAVFDRYGWHEFAVVLIGDDEGPQEWRFSLTDAGIEAPHFLDRLQRAAPQVEVLKPKGEPMAGAHPVPAP